jgi:hypothetical protein
VNTSNPGAGTDWKPFPLSDDNWKRIAGPVGLRDDARPALQQILGYGAFLAKLDSTLVPPNATKMSLRQTRQKAAALRRDLCRCDADVLMALISPEGIEGHDASIWMPPRLTRLRSLEKHVEHLDLLIAWLDDAIRHLPKGKTGNKTMARRAVTSKIDELLMRYGSKYRLTPGVKEWDPGRTLLLECFKLLKIETTAISAVRRLAAERNAAKLLRKEN